MLKKIRKFKIQIRPSYVLRNLKRSLNLSALPEELENSLQQEIDKAQVLIAPSALYQSYSKMQTPPPLEPLWKNAPSEAISFSLIAATIGSLIENEIALLKSSPLIGEWRDEEVLPQAQEGERRTRAPSHERPQVVKRAGSEGENLVLERGRPATTYWQGGGVWGEGEKGNKSQILDAIAKEALEQSVHFVAKLISEEAKEENCEPTVLLPLDSIYLQPALSLLEAEKAEIRIGADGQLTPFFSSIRFCFWNPVKKSAKNR